LNRPNEITLVGDTTFATPPSEFRHKGLDDFLSKLSITETEMIEVANACKDELRNAGFGVVSTLTRGRDMHEHPYWVTFRTFVKVNEKTVGQIALGLSQPVSPQIEPKSVDFYVRNAEAVGDDKLRLFADILLAQLYRFAWENPRAL